MDYCKITVTGRLTRDAEYKEVGENKTPMLTCSLAFSPENDEWTNYLNFTLWGKYATVMHQHLTKGTHILVEGKLKQDRWEQGETKRHTFKIARADQVILLGKPRGDEPEQENKKPEQTPDKIETVPF